MIAVTAEIDESITTTDEILTALEEEGLPEIAEQYRVGTLLRGKAEEQATTMGDMMTGAVVALLAIYLILAWIFSSYSRPDLRHGGDPVRRGSVPFSGTSSWDTT